MTNGDSNLLPALPALFTYGSTRDLIRAEFLGDDLRYAASLLSHNNSETLHPQRHKNYLP